MELQRSQQNGVTVIRVNQESRFEGWFAQKLQSLYQSLPEAERRYLTIDLTGTNYIDSSGLSVLIEMLHTAVSLGGCLAIAGLNESTRQILHMTRLDRVIPVFLDVDSAVRELTQAA